MAKASLKPFDHFGHPVQQCVLPLVAKADGALFPVGTGFVINASGLFVTAAHVLEEANGKAIRRINQDGKYYDHYEFFAVCVGTENLPGSDTRVGGLLPIDYVWAPQELDIGFGWLRLPRRSTDDTLLPLHPVRMRPALPKVGQLVAGMGYYEIEGCLDPGTDSVKEFAWRTAISSGTIQEIHPTYRDTAMLSFPCFRTDARFSHGMSGGPVFDEYGTPITRLMILG